jgi:hypothetical protein
LDCQDNNAVARLFSAATLEFALSINSEEPEQALLIFLFIFGELGDAYQNREMSHENRAHLALRAYYFIEMWKTYLQTMVAYQGDT